MFDLLAQSTSQPSSSPLTLLVPLVLMGGIAYFILIRPQQRRVKQQQALMSDVGVGDEIVTTAGIFGTIVEVDDEDGVVTLEIAPGTEIRMMKAGIGRKVVEAAWEGDDEDAADDDDADPAPDAWGHRDDDAGAGSTS